MMDWTADSITVESLAVVSPADVDLWISCHGFEARSIEHLKTQHSSQIREKYSFGFTFPESSAIAGRADQLRTLGFDVSVVDDNGFEAAVRKLIVGRKSGTKRHVAADISSMSRSRIAALVVACADAGMDGRCELDLVYFPSSYATHKHSFEPLEHFGPVHRRLCGWPAEPDLPLSALIGLGTECRRADGVVEMLEPDILALYVPVGDEREFSAELVNENRRLLEVGGEATSYPLRDPVTTYEQILSTCASLSSRSRLIVVPLGPKLFTALTVLAAISIGSSVGVWKASPGQSVDLIEVQAAGEPIIARVCFGHLTQ